MTYKDYVYCIKNNDPITHNVDCLCNFSNHAKIL